MTIPDLQASPDTRRITIDKVGVKGIQYPIIVDDRASNTQATVAELNAYVELPHYKRGTHMSRFLEVLNRYHKENLIPRIGDFLLELKTSLRAEAAYVDMAFPYFIEKKAPVSGISSLLNYSCFFRASFKAELDLWIGVKVPVTTLCPCSKEISEAGAHNQRSTISIEARYSDFVWLEELIELAERSASCEIYPLLKRVDEKYVTERAYSNPKFVEDIVRDIALSLDADERITDYLIESENYESIHNHNAYAMIKRSKAID